MTPGKDRHMVGGQSTSTATRKKKCRIAVLEGDGIGPEVVSSAKRVLMEAASKYSLDIEAIDLDIGLSAYRKFGRSLPPETLEVMRDCDGWILGPLQAGSYPKDDKDYPMASGRIRKAFDLYANIRPVKSLLPSSRQGIDLVIVRENTEDFYPDRNLYKGYGEFWPNADTVLSLRVITRNACRRISETAFQLARSRGNKNLVTAVHKANVLIEGDGLFLEEVRKDASKYPNVKLEDKLVDSAALQLVTSPESFDVLLTTNMFGDILSDEAAGLVGGLGLAPSLNAGDRHAMAQAVHGSAPDIAGRRIANPTAEILSTSMLLEWLHSKYGDERLLTVARSISKGVSKLLQKNDSRVLTPDLGGSATTEEFTSHVVENL
ncbi:MAG TPA: isocitrate/isopropylmalate dehydrogenase family protein [Nitrososphaerales archaeon]|nr:isocitrate/isopropylmalate dehydrogenase family protein [Nitrososphaerales archaeon]